MEQSVNLYSSSSYNNNNINSPCTKVSKKISFKSRLSSIDVLWYDWRFTRRQRFPECVQDVCTRRLVTIRIRLFYIDVPTYIDVSVD